MSSPPRANTIATLDPYQGTGRQQCTQCQRKSVAGLVRGSGLCPAHYAEHAFGHDWAASLYPEAFLPRIAGPRPGVLGV